MEFARGVQSVSTQVRIGVMDARPLVLLGLRSAIEREPDFTVAFAAPSPAEAYEQAAASTTDVLIWSSFATAAPQGESARDNFARDKQALLTTPIGVRKIPTIWLAEDPQEAEALRALHSGARGYLSDHLSQRALVDAIRLVHRGEIALPRSIARQLTRELTAGAAAG